MGESFFPDLATDRTDATALACAARFTSRREADDHGLVVLAMGLPYWLEEAVEGFGVWVEARQLEAVREEFGLYDAANADWPPRVPSDPSRAAAPLAWVTPMLWAVMVTWFHQWQIATGDRALAWGALDGARVFAGNEWWRPFTALFLHGDGLHLLANVAIGVIVFAQLIARTGVGRGWRDLAVAAYAGNVAAAALHLADGARSIGASTAVFAAIGLLAGYAAREGLGAPTWLRWRALGVPLGAGVVLLGMLGAGGANVDVVAHLTGFLAGLAWGFARRVLASEPAQAPSVAH